MLSVKRRVYLIKEVEGCRVTFLDGKDKGQGHQGFLPAGELLHLPSLAGFTGEGYLRKDRVMFG